MCAPGGGHLCPGRLPARVLARLVQPALVPDPAGVVADLAQPGSERDLGLP